jgi:hypothetical protein
MTSCGRSINRTASRTQRVLPVPVAPVSRMAQAPARSARSSISQASCGPMKLDLLAVAAVALAFAFFSAAFTAAPPNARRMASGSKSRLALLPTARLGVKPGDVSVCTSCASIRLSLGSDSSASA